jgi:putative NADH-flavin reductase
MKVLVVGAAGRTGRLVCQRAKAAGHEVTALSRHQPKGLPEGVRFVQGDAREAALDEAMKGQEAVVVAVAHKRELPNNVVSDITQKVIKAMKACGAKRLVVVSGAQIGHPEEKLSFALKPRPWLLGETIMLELEDRRLQERLVMHSELEWTIVRPPRLTDGPAKGRYREGPDLELGAFASLSREDLAQWIVEKGLSEETIGKATCVAY